MSLSVKRKREIIWEFIKDMPKIFSDKIYAAMVMDRDISILELMYDENFQKQTLQEARESLSNFDSESFVRRNGINSDEENWFLLKYEIIKSFSLEIATIYTQIIGGEKINEKLIEFYIQNQINIDNWYYSSDVPFDDSTTIQALFCNRFDVYNLENAPMRLINVIYSDHSIIEIIQSYHKDKINLWY